MELIEELKAFQTFLRDEQQKFTRERALIAKEALFHRRHFTAEDLLEAVHRRDPSVSRASVYRTIALLVKSKLLEKHDFGVMKNYYERLVGIRHHDHLICIHCGEIIEFHNDTIERLQDVILKRHHFTMVYHSHKIFGLCRKCQ